MREIITYKTINVSDKSDKDMISKLIKNIRNEPIEIRGITSVFFILQLFVELRKYATEVIYRKSEEDQAVLVFSSLNKEEYNHPIFVEEISEITEEKWKELQQKSINANTDNLDIEKLWEESDQDLKTFRDNLWSISDEIKKLHMKLNTKEPILYLLTVNRFYPHVDSIYLEDKKIK